MEIEHTEYCSGNCSTQSNNRVTEEEITKLPGKDRGQMKHFTGDLKRRDDKMRYDKSSTPTMEINTSEDGGRMKPPPAMEIKIDENCLSYEDRGFLLCVVVKMKSFDMCNGVHSNN
ncbi:hypothetical protein LOK49_Contig322G00003 [Camellia lanceoleosa]|nr:hypothetical protein LOK49_Contig322G00003 [Camellia lanceoleosa]